MENFKNENMKSRKRIYPPSIYSMKTTYPDFFVVRNLIIKEVEIAGSFRLVSKRVRELSARFDGVVGAEVIIGGFGAFHDSEFLKMVEIIFNAGMLLTWISPIKCRM